MILYERKESGADTNEAPSTNFKILKKGTELQFLACTTGPVCEISSYI